MKKLKKMVNSLNLLTSKPILYVANVDENEIISNDYSSLSKRLKAYATQQKSLCLRICASVEQDISTFDGEEKRGLFKRI